MFHIPVLIFPTVSSTDTKYLWWIFPEQIKKTLFRICYTGVGQKVSICDYWNGEDDGGKCLLIAWVEPTCGVEFSPEKDKKCCFHQILKFPHTDPHQRLRYLQGSIFLARLNGDTPHKDMKGTEVNFLYGKCGLLWWYALLQANKMYFSIQLPQHGGKTSCALRSLCWLVGQMMTSSRRGSPGLNVIKIYIPTIVL